LIPIRGRLLGLYQSPLESDALLLVNGCSWCWDLASLHSIVRVPGIAVGYGVLGFGHSSSEGSPIGSRTVSGPRMEDSVDAFAEEEEDGKTIDENRAEDGERDYGLNGLCR
jgi:hypothetical protein